MDELENRLPQEPEHTDQILAAESDLTPAEPEAGQIPVAEEKQENPPAQRPARRSPFENSPYMMPHQQPVQAPPPETPPVAEIPVRTEEPAQEQPVKVKKGKVWLTLFVLIGAVLLLNFMTARWGADMAEDRAAAQIQALEGQIEALQEQLNEQQDTGDSVSGTPNTGIDGGMTPGQVFAQNEKSVVLIQTDVATGSGFILTADGYVVTNYHVVEGGNQIRVVLHDSTYQDATLVGYEANNDVALLKMEGADFPAVTLGSSDDLIVGDQVAAIGNPLGELTSTLTVGFVSAKERDVSTDSSVINMIQTDCAINSGNSGGPLFNMKGEVVGITTAKYSGLSSSGASIEGIGFAIPIDDVVGILDDLMEFGYVKSAYLGITVYTLGPGSDQPQGCLVNTLEPAGCAAEAGVLPGDIIIDLGGHKVQGYTDLARALREFDGGETTTITVWREGQGEITLDITLDAKPRESIPETDEKPLPENGSYEEWYDYFFGE